MGLKSVVKYMLLSFVFVALVVMVFGGVWWFSDRMSQSLFGNHTLFSANLQGGIDSADASQTFLPSPIFLVSPSPTLLPTPLPTPDHLSLNSRAAISVAVNPLGTKTLFAKNGQVRFPIASLTKLMTAKVVLDNYDLSQMVTIDQDALNQEGEQGDLKLGQALSVKALLYIALIESSNRAAYGLSEVMGNSQFVVLMNIDAQKMGLTNTSFQDPTGLTSANYSTVEDLTKLTQDLFENYPLFSQIIALKKFDLYLPNGSLHHSLITTDQLLGQDNIIGGKTGYTDEALGCFMAIQQTPGDLLQKKYVINIILGSQDRFADMQSMINWVSRN